MKIQTTVLDAMSFDTQRELVEWLQGIGAGLSQIVGDSFACCGNEAIQDAAAALHRDLSSLSEAVLQDEEPIKVEGLKIELMSETMKDADLKKALDQLTSDFTSMVNPV